jgi:hypothetical protein
MADEKFRKAAEEILKAADQDKNWPVPKFC